MKIPQRAKRVFQGIVYDIFQWKATNFDGSVATFEAAKRRDSVQIIAVNGKQVFVARERQPGRAPFYSLFGGRVEEEETPLAAAKRELREESGLVSHQWRRLEAYDVPGRIQWRIHYYVAGDCQLAEKQSLDPGEKIIVRKVSFARFIQLLHQPDFRGSQRPREWIAGAPAKSAVAALAKKLFL